MSLVDLLQISLVSTGRETFYNEKEDVMRQLIQSHITVLKDDRRRYSMLSLFPLTRQAKTMILRGLLATGRQRQKDQDQLEWDLIVEILDSLSITEKLRFYLNVITQDSEKLGTKAISNNRTKRIGKKIWDEASAYQILKYKKKFSKLIRRAHISVANSGSPEKQELNRWLRNQLTAIDEVVYCEILKTRFQVLSGDLTNIHSLPYSIVERIAADHGMSREEFRAKATESKTISKGEKKKDQSMTKTDLGVDWRQYPLMELVRYARDNQQSFSEMLPSIEEKAGKIAVLLIEKVIQWLLLKPLCVSFWLTKKE